MEKRLSFLTIQNIDMKLWKMFGLVKVHVNHLGFFFFSLMLMIKWSMFLKQALGTLLNVHYSLDVGSLEWF